MIVPVLPEDLDDPFYQRALIQWAETVDGLNRRWMTDVPDDLVQPQSDLAGDDAITAPFHVSHEAKRMLGIATDNLHCARSLLVHGERPSYSLTMRTWGVFPQLRAAIEIACQCAWMLIPDERNLRLRRLLQLLMVSEHGQRDYVESRIARPVGSRPIEKPPIVLDEHLQHLVNRLEEAGVEGLRGVVSGGTKSASRILAETGQALADDRRSPVTNPTLLLSSWRALSGMAHGDRWASSALPEQRVVAELPDDVLRTEVSMSAGRYVLWVSLATSAVEEAARLFDRRCLAFVDSGPAR